MKIVILDSGLDVNSSLAKEINFSGGIEIFENQNNEIEYLYNSTDDMGHGTAIASYVRMLLKDAEILPIKIMKNNLMASNNVLCAALEYILEYIPCDVINISAGIVSCDDKNRLYAVCKNLVTRGSIIVSAYDNGGAISYPAAFDCVIGIDGKRRHRNPNQYMKVEGHFSDYVGVLREHRLCFLNNHVEICSGNSFIAPEFTVKVACMMDKGINSLNEILNILDKEATGISSSRTYQHKDIPFDINHAIVFPYNKEMHSVARFEDLLSFTIQDYYDIKYSRNIGKTIEELSNIKGNKRVVKNIDLLDWSLPFDTVILGHTSIISGAIGRDIEKEIINLCKKYNKNLYSCHDIRTSKDLLDGLNFYCPYVENYTIPEFAKMYVMGCPVLGVVGTGGSQGKYTLQLGIRKELLQQGYKVGQLGTEPTAQLFGMDCVYPMGHECSVYAKGFTAVLELNNMMGYIESKNPDIIIFGSQANTVPFHVGGPQDYPIVQHELILGCQADAYILCVSGDATIPYVKRTISYLEGVYNSKVIAIVLSPFSIGYRWSTISGGHTNMSTEELSLFEKSYKEDFEIPVLVANTDNIYTQLVNIIIEYFSEGTIND